MGSRLFCLLVTVGAAFAQGPQFVIDSPPSIAAVTFSRSIGADVDGDGDLDLIGLNLFFQARLLRNDDGQLVDVTASQMPVLAGAPYAAAAFDADGDGDVDLFLCGNGMPGQLLRNDGTGTFVVAQSMPFASSQIGVVAADLDGDGDLDLALSGSALVSSLDQVLENDGTGSFSVAVQLVLPLSSRVVASDVDGDGDEDLIYSDDMLRVYRNDGAFTFVDITATAVAASTSWSWEPVAADLDGDGDEDLVLRRRGPDPDLVLMNVGGVLTQVASLSAVGETDSIVIGDIDGDGDLDVVRSQDTGTVSVAINDGTGTLTDTPSRLPAQGLWAYGLQFLDSDGDQDPDLYGWFPSSSFRLRNRDIDLEVGGALLAQNWSCTLRSQPGYGANPATVGLAIGVARLPQALALPGIGNLLLDLTAPHVLLADVILPANGAVTIPFAVPGAPSLVGTELHAQGIVAAGATLRLTSLQSAVIQ